MKIRITGSPIHSPGFVPVKQMDQLELILDQVKEEQKRDKRLAKQKRKERKRD